MASSLVLFASRYPRRLSYSSCLPVCLSVYLSRSNYLLSTWPSICLSLYLYLCVGLPVSRMYVSLSRVRARPVQRRAAVAHVLTCERMETVPPGCTKRTGVLAAAGERVVATTAAATWHRGGRCCLFRIQVSHTRTTRHGRVDSWLHALLLFFGPTVLQSNQFLIARGRHNSTPE